MRLSTVSSPVPRQTALGGCEGQQLLRLLIFILKQRVSLTAASHAFWQHVEQVLEWVKKVLLVGAVTAVVHGCLHYHCFFFGVSPGEVT